MAIFPDGRSLIAPPSRIYSNGKSVTLGAERPRYPASYATDGSLTPASRSLYGTDTWTVNLGVVHTPNIFGVGNHNIDYGKVCGFQASNAAGFGSLLLDRGASARRPCFWIDLRGFPTTAQYYRLAVNGNTRPLSIGEVIIAEGYAFHGSLQNLPAETLSYPQERMELEFGAQGISASGALIRRGTLLLSVPASELAFLDAIFEEMSASDERVVVVPNTRRNDLWFVDWPDNYTVEYRDSDREGMIISIALDEQAGGVL